MGEKSPYGSNGKDEIKSIDNIEINISVPYNKWWYVKNVGLAISSAMSHLHQKGICHGDLYAHNIISHVIYPDSTCTKLDIKSNDKLHIESPKNNFTTSPILPTTSSSLPSEGQI